MHFFSDFAASHPGLASIVRNGAWRGASVAYLFAIRVLYVVALSRLLGPEGYGFFAYAQTYYLTFLPLVLLGMDLLVPVEIGHKGRAAGPLLVRLFSFRLVLALAVALLIGVGGALSESGETEQMALLLICLALVPRCFQNFCVSIFTGFEQARAEARLMMLFRGLEVAFGAVLLWLCGAGVLALVGLHVLVWLAYALCCLRAIRRDHVPLAFAWDPIGWRSELWQRSQWLAALQAFLAYILLHGLLLLYRHLEPDAAMFGQFALAWQAVMLISAFLQALLAGGLPVMARSHARGDGKSHRFTLLSCGLMFVAGWLIIGLLSWLAQPLITLLAGGEYGLAAQWMVPMALCLPFAGIYQPIHNNLVVQNRLGLVVLIDVLGLAGMVLMALWRLPQVAAGQAMIEALVGGVAMGAVCAMLAYGWARRCTHGKAQ